MTKPIRLSLLLSALVATPALAAPEAPAESRIVVSAADLAGSNDIRRCRDETSAAIAADRDRLVQLASRSAPIVIAAR